MIRADWHSAVARRRPIALRGSEQKGSLRQKGLQSACGGQVPGEMRGVRVLSAAGGEAPPAASAVSAPTALGGPNQVRVKREQQIHSSTSQLLPETVTLQRQPGKKDADTRNKG